MNIWLYVIIFILILICILLIIKIINIKKALKEIEKSLNNILKSDTNNLITTSSSDKYIENLIIIFNNELKIMRNQKLQYKNGNQELKRTITDISHDLRTPLTAIKGYIDLIKEENSNKKNEKYIKIIEKKSNELVELTEQLFDFSKTLDMNIEINKENCCINEILEETLIDYYKIFKEKNIKPEILLCEEKVYRMINKASIVRIFENILSNILKYSNNNFKVELKNSGKIIFSNKATNLDETTVQKIFDRYFTVENAKKATGLGLSIAKQLVELNNGTINAKYIKDILIIEIELI